MNTTDPQPLPIKSEDHDELAVMSSVELWYWLKYEANNNGNFNWKEKRRGDDALLCRYRDAACIIFHRHYAQLDPDESDMDDELHFYLAGAVGLYDSYAFDPGTLMHLGEKRFWDGGAARFAELEAACSPANTPAAQPGAAS